MNRDRDTLIHVIILGVDTEEELAKEECKSMGAVSKLSLCVDVTMSNVDTAFDSISSLIWGQAVKCSCAQGVIMEKF